jgi:hypothetical protein
MHEADSLFVRRPAWVEGTGSLSRGEARFLFEEAIGVDTDVAVEIGTASGFSTALLTHALSRVKQDFRVATYDIAPTFYGDASKRTGDAARELLPPELLERVTFHAPATAMDVRNTIEGEVGLLFIDGNHAHPWPTLDLLGTLDCLRHEAVVVLHDIDLPRVNPGAGAGASYLFAGLDGEKRADGNIGSVVLTPAEPVRARLLDILHRHEWQVDVTTKLVEAALAG